jgi:hypothetical protein
MIKMSLYQQAQLLAAGWLLGAVIVARAAWVGAGYAIGGAW